MCVCVCTLCLFRGDVVGGGGGEGGGEGGGGGGRAKGQGNGDNEGKEGDGGCRESTKEETEKQGFERIVDDMDKGEKYEKGSREKREENTNDDEAAKADGDPGGHSETEPT